MDKPGTRMEKTEDNARIAKFLLLTGLRISETQKGNIDGDLFRIDDTKGRHSKKEKRPHWVYLTKTSGELLPSPKSTATNIQAWLERRLAAEGYKDEDRFTPQDLRRTFATGANTIGLEFYIVERCLNHKLPGVMAVYNQADYMAERIETYKRVEKHTHAVLGE